MPDTQDTQVERVSQLDIGDGKLYEFAGANSGIVFDTIADAQAAIQAGTVKDGDVFYVKYVSSGGTEIEAAGVGYDNTESGLDANNVQDAVDELDSELSDSYLLVNTQLAITLATADGVKTVSELIEDALNTYQNIQVPDGHLYEVIEMLVPYGNGNNTQVTMRPQYPLAAKNSFHNLEFQLYAIRFYGLNTIAIYSCTSNYKTLKAIGLILASSTPGFEVFNSYDTRVPASGTKFLMYVKDFKKI